MKKYISYVVIFFLVCGVFLLSTQWKSREIKELYGRLDEKDEALEQCYDENARLLIEVEGLEKEKQEITERHEDTVNTLSEEIEELKNQLSNKTENLVNSTMTENEMAIYTNEVLYKMFYGKWIIKSVIEGRTFDETQVNNFIGKIVEYSENSIKVDGEEVLSAPAYAYGIIPIERYWEFVQGYSPYEEFINEQGDYFVYISVETWRKGFVREDYIFKHFFIVDDSTLILDAYDGFYVMERLEHIENYDLLETFQDYSW